LDSRNGNKSLSFSFTLPSISVRFRFLHLIKLSKSLSLLGFKRLSSSCRYQISLYSFAHGFTSSKLL
ncbi:hypothetical protein AT1G29535, partial [Arabidopsis thaliana]